MTHAVMQPTLGPSSAYTSQSVCIKCPNHTEELLFTGTVDVSQIDFWGSLGLELK